MQHPPTDPQGPEGPTGPQYPPYVPAQPSPQYPPPYPPNVPPQYPAPYPPQYPPPYPPPYSMPLPPMAPPPATMYLQNQSFTGKAVVAFLLYWLGYVPGLIFNIMFINEARRVEAETGRTPAGYGCLWATLVGSLVPAVIFLGFCFFIFAALLASSASPH